MLVDSDGDVFLPKISKDYKSFFTVRVTRDNKRFQYPGLLGEYVVGNRIYDLNGNPVVNMDDKKDTASSSKSPRLFNERDVKIDKIQKKSIYISLSKINAYLRTKNKSLNINKLEIPLEQEPHLLSEQEVLGIDEEGYIYVWYGFEKKRYELEKEKVCVYSPNGKLKTNIDLNVNELDPDYPKPFFVKLTDNGDIFHMWVSKEGVYIYKWSHQ
jgi:hypothetical protein